MGKNQPTILLYRDGGNQSLPFDVSGQRCIWYEDATHLSELLKVELVKLGVVVRSGPSSATQSGASTLFRIELGPMGFGECLHASGDIRVLVNNVRGFQRIMLHVKK